jgi:hypothetical protein
MVYADKGIYARVKKPTVTETISLNILRWFGYVQRMEEKEFPKEYYI